MNLVKFKFETKHVKQTDITKRITNVFLLELNSFCKWKRTEHELQFNRIGGIILCHNISRYTIKQN